jgi:hypothetical protein
LGPGTVENRDVLAPSWPESGSTGRQIETPGVWSASAAVTLETQDRPRHRWPPLKSLLTAANLAVAEIYEPPRRHWADISHNYVLVLGDEVAGVFQAEPESVITFASKRPTLWLPAVPILPRRRVFFGIVTGDDE